MKKQYKKEELMQRLIRPLTIGERFLVKEQLTDDYNDDMEQHCDCWVEVIDQDEWDEGINGDSIYYQIKEDAYHWYWAQCHMNIFETNLMILKKDGSTLFSSDNILTKQKELNQFPII